MGIWINSFTNTLGPPHNVCLLVKNDNATIGIYPIWINAIDHNISYDVLCVCYDHLGDAIHSSTLKRLRLIWWFLFFYCFYFMYFCKRFIYIVTSSFDFKIKRFKIKGFKNKLLLFSFKRNNNRLFSRQILSYSHFVRGEHIKKY